MESPKIRNAKHYVANYAALAQALGSERTQPHETELALLTSLVKGRTYHWGSLCHSDIFLMMAMIAILQPRQALEIGTASGTSAALLSAAIARSYTERGEPLPETLLHTIDRKSHCLFDETKPIGFAVAEIVPDLAARVKIHTLGDSSQAASCAGARSLTFAFIDGNHQHPWPLIDLLHLLPLMQPGGWIVLDDISQPDYHPGPDARFGPRYVFDAWPAARLEGMNVGAVQVPADLQTLKPCILTLLEKPFEVSESGWKRYRQQLATLIENLGRDGSPSRP